MLYANNNPTNKSSNQIITTPLSHQQQEQQQNNNSTNNNNYLNHYSSHPHYYLYHPTTSPITTLHQQQVLPYTYQQQSLNNNNQELLPIRTTSNYLQQQPINNTIPYYINQQPQLSYCNYHLQQQQILDNHYTTTNMGNNGSHHRSSSHNNMGSLVNTNNHASRHTSMIIPNTTTTRNNNNTNNNVQAGNSASFPIIIEDGPTNNSPNVTHHERYRSSASNLNSSIVVNPNNSSTLNGTIGTQQRRSYSLHNNNNKEIQQQQQQNNLTVNNNTIPIHSNATPNIQTNGITAQVGNSNLITSPTSNGPFPSGLIIGQVQKYKLLNKIGNGAFGEVYLATTFQGNNNIESNQIVEYFAVKLETIPTGHQQQAGKQQLIYEAKVISYLFNTQTTQLVVGIPRVYWYGSEGHYNIMVMDLLGPSLESLFKKCNRKFTLKTVLMLADQMIQRIEFTHRRNFVHRDIKPDNFLMGRKTSNGLSIVNGQNVTQDNVVYLIDFGLSKMYMTDKGHIPLRKDKHLTGTARYASLNNHKGYEQSRRDDLESLGYVLLYFLKGSLPWQGLTGKTKEEHYNNIYTKKKSVRIVSLTKGLPIEFATYLNYTRGLKFYQEPDYLYLRNLFLNLFVREKYIYDFEWDWVLIEKKQRLEQQQSSTSSLK